jgi:O-antigen ligase
MLSLSRGGMLALVGGVAVVAARSSRWALGLCLLLLATSPLWVPSYVLDRITSSTVEDNAGGGVQVDNSSEIRLVTWRAILEVVEHHPLDGVGFDGLGFVLPDVGTAMGLGPVADSAHNTYLRMLGDLGIFGLLLFLWVLWSVWRLADAGVRHARSRFDRSLAIGLGGAIVAMAVSCMFGDRFWSPVVSSSLWAVCALVEDSLLEQKAKAAA